MPAAGAQEAIQVYRDLLANDRPRLFDRCARELRRRALLLDAERVVELLALLLAATGAEQAGAQAGDWSGDLLAAAIEQARRQDRERAEPETDFAHEEDYVFLTEVFFVPEGGGARAAHAFNRLPRTTRRATLELLLHARSVDDCLAEGLATTPEELGARARTGLIAIMQIDEAMLEIEITADGKAPASAAPRGAAHPSPSPKRKDAGAREKPGKPAKGRPSATSTDASVTQPAQPAPKKPPKPPSARKPRKTRTDEEAEP